MLRDDDLSRFREHFRKATSVQKPAAHPAITLKAEVGLFPEEVWRLALSLQIAAVLGDADKQEAIAATAIAHSIQGLQRCLDLDHDGAWQTAIAAALEKSDSSLGFSERSTQVGHACRRLRDQNYELSIGAYGVALPDTVDAAIAKRIDELVAQLGGVATAVQICAFLSDSKLIHHGMWLLGDRIPGIWAMKQPALPIGWLFSLAVRHLQKNKPHSDPVTIWAQIVHLATDYCAALDCQRYSQFEEMDIRPATSWRVLRDSLIWREVFTLPQVPTLVLPYLQEAFTTLLTSEEHELFEWSFDNAFEEIHELLARSKNDNLTLFGRTFVEKHYPNLCRMGIAESGTVNNGYVNPTSGGARNHNDSIFFAHDSDGVLTFPTPLLCEAFCQITFAQIWKKLSSSRASKVVGQTLERALQRACAGKAASIHSNLKYWVGKESFEIDIAAHDGTELVLFETKAKSLTAKARSGDMMAFYSDYTDSFLAMVGQLVRHEDHLRQQIVPGFEKTSEQSLLKVAVSPLSYGPANDRLLAGSLLKSFYSVKLSPVSDDRKSKEATQKFNSAVKQIYDIALKTIPRTPEGSVDLFKYFFDFYWLDLGQVLYALDRASTVSSAFRPLRFITYSTRDYWTEVASADMQGLTKNYWRQL